jgi:signal transduction histidine kinase
MRKIAIIFLLAVIVPSVALACLALRSLHDEQLILKARQIQLFQTVANSFAAQSETLISDKQREFANTVEALLATAPVSEVANTFDERLRKTWPWADVGFALTVDGNVTSPNMLGRTEGRRFRVENDKWLSSRESTEVFVSTVKGSVNLKLLDEAVGADEKIDPGKLATLKSSKLRTVAPPDISGKAEAPISKVAAAETDFRQLVGDRNEGIVARFLQDKLHVMMWYRSARDYNTIFGAQLDLRQVKEALVAVVEKLDVNLRRELCLAILDENANAVALPYAQFTADWKHPLAATEIGEMLPHWEAAVYPLNPAKLDRAAATVRLTVGALIAGLVAAIAIGSFLLLVDLRRQLRLAAQKTDFVSNVSHELKTPLTSIRMFSELLAEGTAADDEKRSAYLKIIGAETARLTRLIDNILDFARTEKGERKYKFEDCDIAKIVREAVENYRPQMKAHGFMVETEIPNDPIIARGDCDALAQVILNLLSNAKKYSGDRKEIRIGLWREGSWLEVRVLDRGLGVPAAAAEKIFEQFYRAHDSLSSGIQGSGLGLTLSRQIARAHGGDVLFAPREGGGSIFTVRLPLEESA